MPFIINPLFLSQLQQKKNKRKNILSNWEAWPFKLIYMPIVPVWFWYMLRSRAVWFFTPSNPKLTFGGMEGEPKREMYELLPANSYPSTFNVLPGAALQSIEESLLRLKITYPFIVKPEIGGQGILFRKIEDKEALVHYHKIMPFEYIVQEMVFFPMEVSVFHIRHPEDEKGVITGFLHKVPLHIVGDGKTTVGQLIRDNPKAEKRRNALYSKFKAHWDKILEDGEKMALSYAANHNQGAHFIDLKDQIDDRLLKVFDDISHSINDFFYGRYDILCESVEDLKQGKNYSILEYNGCGAEPNHFYDNGYTLRQAYKEILKHWKALYEISNYNAQNMVSKPWGFWKGLKFRKETIKLMKKMKETDALIG